MIQLQLTLDAEMPSLDAYAVRVSARARSVSLRVLPGIGLEVTIPRRFNRSGIPAIVRENRAWIEKAMAELAHSTRPEFLLWPPRELELAACEQTLSVTIEELARTAGKDDEGRYSARLEGNILSLQAPVQSRQKVAELIAKILKVKARQVLEPQVVAHACCHGLQYKRLVIRGQRTLWGSYSSSGTLSLNYKLLFLRPALVRYVILHELAHTKHLDHSSAFWDLLEKLQPGARELDRELGEAVVLVPPWLENRP